MVLKLALINVHGCFLLIFKCDQHSKQGGQLGTYGCDSDASALLLSNLNFTTSNTKTHWKQIATRELTYLLLLVFMG